MSCETRILINALKQSNEELTKAMNEQATPELLKEHLRRRIEINNHTINMCSNEREVVYA